MNTISLKVKEGLAKDVGRAIVRLDPEDMRRIDAQGGDILLLEGKRKTVAKAMPCYAEERGKSIIQLDGIIRENAGVGLDEKISVSKISAPTATRVVLQPLSGTLKTERDSKYLATLLDGTPVMQGDRIRTVFFRNETIRVQSLGNCSRRCGCDFNFNATQTRTRIFKRTSAWRGV
jgi:transitional endoplasmic reticulum ATPase